MALLTLGLQTGPGRGMARGLLLLLLLVATAGSGCAEQGSPGSYRFDLYDARVSCDPTADTCQRDGAPAQPERVGGDAFVSRTASRFAPYGLYLYLELRRRDGTLGHLELDAPLLPTGNQQASLRYAETAADGELQQSVAVSGALELPGSPACACQDGRFDLEFVLPGPDQQLGTDDDLIRRLTRGSFSRTGARCHTPRILLPLPDRELTTTILPCPRWATPRGASTGGTAEEEVLLEEGCLLLTEPSEVTLDGEEEEEEIYVTEEEYDEETGGCDEGGTTTETADAEGCATESGPGEEEFDEPTDYTPGEGCSDPDDPGDSADVDLGEGCDSSGSGDDDLADDSEESVDCSDAAEAGGLLGPTSRGPRGPRPLAPTLRLIWLGILLALLHGPGRRLLARLADDLVGSLHSR